MINVRLMTVALLSIILTLLTFEAGAAPGKRGGMDSGGGDPLANEFLNIGRMIAGILSNDTNDQFGVTQSELLQELDVLKTSLEGHQPKLIFPPGETVDCFGAPKLGCVKNGVIYIARESWENKSSLQTKIELAAMELLLRLGIDGRYDKAPELAKFVMAQMNLTGARPPMTDKPCVETADHRCFSTAGLLYANPSKLGGVMQDMRLDQPMAIDIAPMKRICLRRSRSADDGRSNSFIIAEYSLNGTQIRDLEDNAVAIFSTSHLPAELPLNGFSVIRAFTLPNQKMMAQVGNLARKGYAFRMFFDWKTNMVTTEIRSGSDIECTLPAIGN